MIACAPDAQALATEIPGPLIPRSLAHHAGGCARHALGNCEWMDAFSYFIEQSVRILVCMFGTAAGSDDRTGVPQLILIFLKAGVGNSFARRYYRVLSKSIKQRQGFWRKGAALGSTFGATASHTNLRSLASFF